MRTGCAIGATDLAPVRAVAPVAGVRRMPGQRVSVLLAEEPHERRIGIRLHLGASRKTWVSVASCEAHGEERGQ